MNHASLFSGIGGPEVAAAMLGWTNVFHCEINPFGRKILDFWFPQSKSYEDITKTDFTKYRGQIDVLTGGFPCQPFSYAGKRGGRQTTVISGRRCSALLTKSGPLGSLVKMLLESPLWWSPARQLAWEARPLFSQRIMEFTDSNLNSPLPSNESAEISSQRDIPSSRCLFRLAVSERPTDETGSSLLLITPTAVMTCESPENMKAGKEKNGYQNGTMYGSLESQIMYDPRVLGLLPTPLATEVDHTRRVRELKETGTKNFHSRANGESRPNSIMDYLTFHDLLPTITISEVLPTPSARDWKGRTNPGVVKEGSGCIYGETLPDAVDRIYSDQKKDGKPFRLSPLFTEEMMGFPLMWTAYPFLSENGEQNP